MQIGCLRDPDTLPECASDTWGSARNVRHLLTPALAADGLSLAQPICAICSPPLLETYTLPRREPSDSQRDDYPGDGLRPNGGDAWLEHRHWLGAVHRPPLLLPPTRLSTNSPDGGWSEKAPTLPLG